MTQDRGRAEPPQVTVTGHVAAGSSLIQITGENSVCSKGKKKKCKKAKWLSGEDF